MQDIGLDVEEFIILMEEEAPQVEDNLWRACVAEFFGLMLFQAHSSTSPCVPWEVSGCSPLCLDPAVLWRSRHGGR